MSERRFTDKFELAPSEVWGLQASHPAMRENRSLFPATVVTVTKDAPDRLLVSGKNNRKLGETVEKGRFRGYALFQLSLEERATCPTYCEVRDVCYGNGMQMARRHRIGNPDVFFDRLDAELKDLTRTHQGVMVRLHVLGDFPSVEYVGFWINALAEYENLACYGYTHRKFLRSDADETGMAILNAKQAYPDRFRIRWSTATAVPDGAAVLSYMPDTPTVAGNVVCPAQTDATACCATCGFCWENKEKAVLFVKHGRRSPAVAAKAVNDSGSLSAAEVVALRVKPSDVLPAAPIAALPTALCEVETVDVGPEFETRPIIPIQLPPGVRPNKLEKDRPDVRMIAVHDMQIETAYQRNLSPKSISLIRRIVANWNWTKFKCPIISETGTGKFNVVDGQHTAIAAASHPQIMFLPCVVIDAASVQDRAASFVSHNTDRVQMTAHQIFIGRAAAGDKVAADIMAIIESERGIVPKWMPKKGQAAVGEIIGIGKLEELYRAHGPDLTRRAVRAVVKSRLAPANSTIFRALSLLFADATNAAADVPDDVLIEALSSFEDFERASVKLAAASNQQKYKAAKQLVVAAIGRIVEARYQRQGVA